MPFQKPADYETYGGESDWWLQSEGMSGFWQHRSGWCEKAVPELPPPAAVEKTQVVAAAVAETQSPMSRADMGKACEELYAKLDAAYAIKFRELEEKLLGTHPPAALTHPPAALALDAARPALAFPSTPVVAEQQFLIQRCMHRQGSELTSPMLYEGKVETHFNNWSHHLGSTLFEHSDQKSWAFHKAMERCWSTMVVTACRTQANRFYYVRCRKCNQYVYGDYGGKVGVEDKIGAQNKLMQFVCTETNAQQELPKV